MLGEVSINSGLKLSHRRKAPPTDGLGGDTSEEALDHVEPGTARRGEVKVEAWTAEQPAMDFGGFMSGVVVNDEAKLTFAVIAEFGVYAFQKSQEFLVTVALVTSAQNSPGGRIVSGKQREGPVTHIIVGLTLGQTRTQWQDGLAALQGLSLALQALQGRERINVYILLLLQIGIRFPPFIFGTEMLTKKCRFPKMGLQMSTIDLSIARHLASS